MGILNSGGSNTITVSNQSNSQLSSATGQTFTVSWLPNGGTWWDGTTDTKTTQVFENGTAFPPGPNENRIERNGFVFNG